MLALSSKNYIFVGHNALVISNQSVILNCTYTEISLNLVVKIRVIQFLIWKHHIIIPTNY